VAFIVEDGTGIEDANAYVDEDFIYDYFLGDRLAMFDELDDEEKEAVIVSATQLVDISYDFIGNRASLEQGLNWPRTEAELQGFTIEGVPTAVKKAVCEAVWIAMNSGGELFSSDNQRKVVEESVAGAVSVKYAFAENAVSKHEVLDKMLRGLYRVEEASSDGPSVGASRVERV